MLTQPAVVHAEGFEPALARELVETRLDEAQQSPRRDAPQGKLDECWRLTGVVLFRIDRIGMPGEREQPLGLHFLDDRLPPDMFIAGIVYLPAGNLSRHKGPVQPDPEPRTELVIIGQRPPDAGNRGVELDGLFDAISHVQPHGCPRYNTLRQKAQPNGCCSGLVIAALESCIGSPRSRRPVGRALLCRGPPPRAHVPLPWNGAMGCRDPGSRWPRGNCASRSRARAENHPPPRPRR